MNAEQMRCSVDKPPAPKKLKLTRQNATLAIISAIANTMLASAILIDISEEPFAGYMMLVLTAAMIANGYVLISLVELKLADSLVHLKSTTLVWLSVVGLIIWLSHNDALANVNQIFGVDPFLLPATVSASTFMHAMVRLKYLFFLIAGGLSLFTLLTFVSACFRRAPLYYSLSLFANLVGFILIISAVVHVMEPEWRRNQVLYHIAHQGDFNYKSPCLNVNGSEAVLYLDSMRERILIAPKINEQEPTTLLTHSFLAPARIPSEFRIELCSYKAG